MRAKPKAVKTYGPKAIEAAGNIGKKSTPIAPMMQSAPSVYPALLEYVDHFISFFAFLSSSLSS